MSSTCQHYIRRCALLVSDISLYIVTNKNVGIAVILEDFRQFNQLKIDVCYVCTRAIVHCN